MTEVPDDAASRRVVNCVMSARSLPYSKACIGSLLRNGAEPMLLRLITDSPEDATQLSKAFEDVARNAGHRLEVLEKAAADELAQVRYRDYPALRAFRNGHPCWRKVTDPELFASYDGEVITIDPDVYFPNRFTFEKTPASGLMLMWQPPNCLLPEPLVQTVFEHDLAMADHTDIGVCQYQAPLPLDFLERFLNEISTAPYASSMHVESIIWAALAMHMGGGYLDPGAWHCFQNSVTRRLERKLGRDPLELLRRIDFSRIKAFHAGGVAKNWLPEAEQAGILGNGPRNQPALAACEVAPFTPYPKSKFERKLNSRALARKLGLYRLLAQ